METIETKLEAFIEKWKGMDPVIREHGANVMLMELEEMLHGKD